MRKAISPLIATVLLIAFTITVATILQNFQTGFINTQLASSTDKSTTALNCAYGKIRINSASYNGTTATLKIRVTNEAHDTDLTNITFSAIMQDSGTSIYGTTCNCGDETLYAAETKFYSNGSVAGGCNITSVYVSSAACPKVQDMIASSGIDFSGC